MSAQQVEEAIIVLERLAESWPSARPVPGLDVESEERNSAAGTSARKQR